MNILHSAGDPSQLYDSMIFEKIITLEEMEKVSSINFLHPLHNI